MSGGFPIGKFLARAKFATTEFQKNLDNIGWKYSYGYARQMMRIYSFIKAYPNLLFLPPEVGFRASWIINYGPYMRQILDKFGDTFKNPIFKNGLQIQGKENDKRYHTVMTKATEHDLKLFENYHSPTTMKEEDVCEISSRIDDALATIANSYETADDRKDKLQEQEMEAIADDADKTADTMAKVNLKDADDDLLNPPMD
jgi:hypothetical protein